LQKQPKLLKFALDMRSKSAIAHFLSKNPVFLYTSGKYPSEYEKTTIVTILADHPKKQGVLVYDLRYDPTPYLEMSTAELVNAWRWKKDSNEPRLPVKSLQFNRCPAVAPLGVLDSASEERIQLTPTKAKKHLEILHSNTGFSERVLEALVQLDTLEQQRFIETTTDVDARLYDGFVSDFDKQKCAQLVALDAPEDMPQFKDTRLQAMFPLYKARNFVQLLSPEERETWESYREQKLLNGNEKSRSATFFKQLEELATRTGNTPNDGYLLEELQLYAQSILPYPDN
jgi:exodeoxyribonuclease-1